MKKKNKKKHPQLDLKQSTQIGTASEQVRSDEDSKKKNRDGVEDIKKRKEEEEAMNYETHN